MLLGIHIFLSIAFSFLLGYFSGHFLNACLIFQLLMDQIGQCCAHSVAPNWLLVPVNLKHAHSVHTKCYCSAVQQLHAAHRLVQYSRKYCRVYIHCADGEVGKCVCRCSHKYCFPNPLNFKCVDFALQVYSFLSKKYWTAVAY